ncbi:MAG: T9SS type A sorting domain-containing protein [Bacteroidales bacterium]|nr:T9SS type A sorting domain-containing protein [Bacteroidales bacterium]
MKKQLHLLIFVIALSAISSSLSAQYYVLFVGKEISDVTDNIIMDTIIEMGYTVDFIPGTEYKDTTLLNPYNIATAYESYDAIVFSESLGSGDVVNFRKAGFPIPSLILEGNGVKVSSGRLGLIADDATEFHQVGGGSTPPKDETCLSLVIDDNSHFITKNYYSSQEVAWSTTDVIPGVTGFNLSNNIMDALPLIKSKHAALAELPMLWAIPEGAVMVNKPGIEMKNTVVFGVITSTLGDSGTVDLYNIIKRSLKWIVGDTVETVIGVNEHTSQILSNIVLNPNPVRKTASISFNLESEALVSLEIIDLVGRFAYTCSPEYYSAGINNISIVTQSFKSGQYFYRLNVNGAIYTGKMIIIK